MIALFLLGALAAVFASRWAPVMRGRIAAWKESER